jgi:methylated-DNA-[protein]-cysteine S-methyltransferase
LNIVSHQKMQKSLRYAIFETKWGYFGLAGTKNALCRTCLPLADPDEVVSQLSKYLSLTSRAGNGKHPAPRFESDKDLFKPLQQQIIAYFEGAYVSFNSEMPITLDSLSPFARSVLTACRSVEFGQVTTYSGLASKLGRAGAARAVGNALAKNPLPLIIPCHRVVRNDGKIGGFSAIGGTDLKARLLKHEQAWLMSRRLHQLRPDEQV